MPPSRPESLLSRVHTTTIMKAAEAGQTTSLACHLLTQCLTPLEASHVFALLCTLTFDRQSFYGSFDRLVTVADLSLAKLDGEANGDGYRDVFILEKLLSLRLHPLRGPERPTLVRAHWRIHMGKLRQEPRSLRRTLMVRRLGRQSPCLTCQRQMSCRQGRTERCYTWRKDDVSHIPIRNSANLHSPVKRPHGEREQAQARRVQWVQRSTRSTANRFIELSPHERACVASHTSRGSREPRQLPQTANAESARNTSYSTRETTVHNTRLSLPYEQQPKVSQEHLRKTSSKF